MKKRSSEHKEGFLFYLFALSLILFSLVLNSVQLGVGDVDLGVSNFMKMIYNPWVSLLFEGIHYSFDIIPIMILTLFIAFYLIYRKRYKFSILLLAVMLMDLIIVSSIKSVIGRARPLDAVITLKDFSFPSGHVAGAVVFFGVLIYIFSNYVHHRKIRSFVITSMLAIFIIAFSRLYLGLHWVSDVVGGFLIGTAILSASILVFENFETDR